MGSHHLTIVSPPVTLEVAIYARVSSDQQAERHTIDSQLSDLKARASGDGHCVRDDMLFVDNGHSGTGLVRSALERLRDMVALSAVDVAYVHAPDRLSRSHAHQVLPLGEFARAGTRVVFLNRPIGGSPEDNLLLQLQGMFAEYERAKVPERSRRGKRHRARAGAVSVLSRAPYGHRYISREAGGGAARYDVDEDAARVVREIFAWVGHERLTLAAVCRRLRAAEVPSPSGKAHWSRAMIHTMLLNPAYAGQAVYGRRRCVPRQAPLHPPRGHDGPRGGRFGRSRRRPSSTSACPCRRSSTGRCSRAPRSGWRRTGSATANGSRACATCFAACWSAGSAATGSPATTTVAGGATTGAAAPTAAGITASAGATPGWWPSSRSMTPCGPRSAACWRTPRACWRSIIADWTQRRPARAGSSSTPSPAGWPRRAARPGD
jgi:DNA invertase Pin-like site-specific DNA recombinase